MTWISVLLFACAANLDNLMIGASYGIRKVRISIWSNLFIAGVTGLSTYLAMTFGEIIGRLLSPAFCQWAGGLLLVAIGLWSLGQSLIHKKTEEQEEKKESVLLFSETCVLAFALSLNNLALGAGASILGLPALFTTAATIAASVAFLYVGGFLSLKFFPKLRFAETLSGLLLIALGVYGLLG